MKKTKILIALTTTASVSAVLAPITSCNKQADIDYIYIETEPTKQVFKVGDVFSSTGLLLTIMYKDGSWKTIGTGFTTDHDSKTFSPSDVGLQQVVTISYTERGQTFTTWYWIDVIYGFTSLDITPPTITTYARGEKLNLNGMKVIGHYQGGQIEINSSDYNVVPKNQTRLMQKGQQTITVTLKNGETARQTTTVNVGDPIVKSIAVKTPPTKTAYAQGQNLDLSGLEINGILSDDTQELISKEQCTFDPAEGTALIDKTISKVDIAYKGFKTSQTISIGDPILDSLIVTPPTKSTGYNAGEKVDTEGLVVKAHPTYGEDVDVTNLCTIKPDITTTKLVEGANEFVVTYQNKQSRFTITSGPAIPVKLNVTTKPTKLSYAKGEYLDLTGMVVTKTMSDESQVEVTSSEYTVTPSGGTRLMTTGSTNVIVTLNNYTSCKDTFNINVGNAKIKEISIYADPTKVNYNVGETFDSSGLQLKLTYTDDTTQVISSGFTTNLDGYTFTNEDWNNLDTYIVYYTDGEKQFQVESEDVLTISNPIPTVDKNLKYKWDNSSNGYLAYCSADIVLDEETQQYDRPEFEVGTLVIPDKYDDGEHGEQPVEGFWTKNIQEEDIGGFQYCQSIWRVKLPSSLTKIQCNTFNLCESLIEINLENIKNIEDAAFGDCEYLDEVDLSSIVEIGELAFVNTGLQTITLPASLTSIGEWSFYNCWTLTNVKIDSTIAANLVEYDGEEPTEDHTGLYDMASDVWVNKNITVASTAYLANTDIWKKESPTGGYYHYIRKE